VPTTPSTKRSSRDSRPGTADAALHRHARLRRPPVLSPCIRRVFHFYTPWQSTPERASTSVNTTPAFPSHKPPVCHRKTIQGSESARKPEPYGCEALETARSPSPQMVNAPNHARTVRDSITRHRIPRSSFERRRVRRGLLGDPEANRASRSSQLYVTDWLGLGAPVRAHGETQTPTESPRALRVTSQVNRHYSDVLIALSRRGDRRMGKRRTMDLRGRSTYSCRTMITLWDSF